MMNTNQKRNYDIPLRVSRYVCALDQLEDMEDEGNVISFYIYLENISKLYTRLFVHSPIAREICKIFVLKKQHNICI